MTILKASKHDRNTLWTPAEIAKKETKIKLTFFICQYNIPV